MNIYEKIIYFKIVRPIPFNFKPTSLLHYFDLGRPLKIIKKKKMEIRIGQPE